MSNRFDITLVEVAARDGLQNEANATALSVADKVTFLHMLAQAGLRRIEAGSFVHPRAVPAMANSGDVAAALVAVEEEFPQAIFSYLVPNLKGLARAKEIHAREIAVFLALSEEFSKANINQTVAEAFAAIVPTVEAALADGIRVRGYLSNIFGYTDLPFTPEAVAIRTVELLAMGCFEVSLGDTTALGTPDTTRALISTLAEHAIPLDKIAMHFHDTQGRAIDNVAVAYSMGVRVFDASTGGIGGCPYANSPKGNVAMEDVVNWCNAHAIKTEVGDIKMLQAASLFIRQKLGKMPS